MSDRLCRYGGCTTPSEWSVTAAYPAETLSRTDHVHPRFATYPAPMAHPCRHHLAAVMAQDLRGFGATGAWLVRPLHHSEAAPGCTCAAHLAGGVHNADCPAATKADL
jgi:hypothetical protein